MEIILLVLVFLMFAPMIYGIFKYWWVLLLIIALFLIVAWRDQKDTIERLEKKVVRAEVVKSEPIVKRKAEKTGFSINYGKSISSRDYYRYRNVVTGYKVTFACYFEDGSSNLHTCNQGSREYNILIAKTK